MLLLNEYGDPSTLFKNLSFYNIHPLQMNHENEFTRFACSRSKFSIGFSLKKKIFQAQDYFKQEIRFKEYVIIKQATLKYKLPAYWPYLYFELSRSCS